MAKSNGLRRKDDKFIIKVIIGFVSVLVVLIATLVIYNMTKETFEYDDFDQITAWGEIETQTEDKYLVYYYSESCGYCVRIKDDVLAFADENQADAKLYLMDAGQMTGTNPFPVGDNRRGTPTLHVVVDGVIVESVSGPSSVLEVFEEVESGTHEFYSN